MTRAPAFALLLLACDAGQSPTPPAPPAPPSPTELTVHFGSSPDDTTVVHADGSFSIVIPEFKNHLASCATGPDGICPRHVDACTVTDTVAHCPQVELKRATDGTIDILRLLDVTLTDDGAVAVQHARFVIAPDGQVAPELLQPLPTIFWPPELRDFYVEGASTPELRRRAMFVLLVAIVTRMSIPGLPFPD